MSPADQIVGIKILEKILNELYKTAEGKIKSELAKHLSRERITALANHVESFQRVKTFWQRETAVSILHFYYPSKIIFNNRGEPKRVDSLKDFPSKQNLVIQGTVGQGKSVFLRYLCVQEIRSNGSHRIPLFLELRTLTQSALHTALIQTLERLGLPSSEEVFEFLAKSGRLVLLLDAFDELPEPLVGGILRELELLADRFPMMQQIITARPDCGIQNSQYYRVVQLAPLRPSDHQAFLERLDVEQLEIPRLLRAIGESTTDIIQLLTTPLMLTLLVIVFLSEGAIPAELPEFYDQLFQTLLSRHDKSKPGFRRTHKSQLGERQIQQLFEAFCFFTLLQSPNIVLKEDQFATIFEEARTYSEFNCQFEGFKYDIVKVACLILEDGLFYQFLHKSVLEFYAASFVRHSNEDFARAFYAKLVDKVTFYPHWLEVLRFLRRINEYRYVKYFGIPAIERLLEELGVHSYSDPTVISQSIIEKYTRGVIVGIGEAPNGVGFQVRSFTHVRRPCVYDVVPSGVFHSIFRVRLSKEELSQLIEALHPKGTTFEKLQDSHRARAETKMRGFQVTFSLSALTARVPEMESRIRSEFVSGLDTIFKQLMDYEKFIENESKKTKLLDF